MDKSKSIRTVSICAFAAMLLVNILAQLGVFGGLTAAWVSGLYPTLLTPAAATSAIWIAIYAMLGLYVLYQMKETQQESVDRLFAISCAFNIAWIVLRQYQLMPLAAIAITGLWVSLLLLYSKAEGLPRLARAGFGMYLAWVTMAAAMQILVYVTVAFPGTNARLYAQIIAGLTLTAITAYEMAYMIVKRDLPFALAGTWGMTGILARHDAGNAHMWAYPDMVLISGLLLATLLLGDGIVIAKLVKQRRPQASAETVVLTAEESAAVSGADTIAAAFAAENFAAAEANATPLDAPAAA